MHIYFLVLYFFTYAFLGWCTEVAYAAVKEGRFVNRGFLNGPLCPIYGVGVSAVVVLLDPYKDHLVVLYITSILLVTLLEGITGYAMDKIFHHKWWDYSSQPLNIGGYVCLLFSLIWGAACVFVVKLAHPVIHKVLLLLPVFLGVMLIVFLLAVLSADLYVTASGILNLNRRLEAMGKIAAELHGISDKVGENIYENVKVTMEKTEEGRKKLEAAAEEKKKQAEELKARYANLLNGGTRVSDRLMKAFPKMESRQHKDILEQVKNSLTGRFKKK